MKASNRTKTPGVLVPEAGVSLIDGVLHATSLPAWLAVDPAHAITQHKWVRLRYSCGLFDEPVRPLIRFVAANGKVARQAMNGAILGTAEWIGRIPDGTISVGISPVRRLGPFSFRIEAVQPVSLPALLATALRRDPRRVIWALQEWLQNAREESWQDLAFARGGTQPENYAQWRKRLARRPDFAGFDRPRSDWRPGPTFHLLMRLTSSPEGLDRTIHSLRQQNYERWRLHAFATDKSSADTLSCYQSAREQDARLADVVALNATTGDTTDGGGWGAVIDAGDVLEDYALAALAEAAAADPMLQVIYSDEDRIGPGGDLQAPVLKPDWSPAFNEAVSYLGRLAAVRISHLGSLGLSASGLLSDERRWLDALAAKAGAGAVGHIRRILCHRSVARPAPAEELASHESIRRGPETDWPAVSIVIPTRDRADLLSECLRDLEAATDYPDFGVVVVDNGSTQPRACALLDSLAGKPRYTVLRRNMPFNFSRLCNDGAAQSQAPVIVFLNNDILCFQPHWLQAMVRWAIRPEIGLVGAKLLFPDRRVQHAGVVLGMGGLAGHIYLRQAADAEGYLGQLRHAREVLAVTAACVAVERAKFEAVGGFDAENLAVDLNDVDLCLRLADRGLTNIWTPEATMIHVQSASRGEGGDPFRRYRSERAYFARRWPEVVRDDPYFHPALSLYSHMPALA